MLVEVFNLSFSKKFWQSNEPTSRTRQAVWAATWRLFWEHDCCSVSLFKMFF